MVALHVPTKNPPEYPELPVIRLDARPIFPKLITNLVITDDQLENVQRAHKVLHQRFFFATFTKDRVDVASSSSSSSQTSSNDDGDHPQSSSSNPQESSAPEMEPESTEKKPHRFFFSRPKSKPTVEPAGSTPTRTGAPAGPIDPSRLYKTGVMIEVLRMVKHNNTVFMSVFAHRRCRMIDTHYDSHRMLRAKVEHLFESFEKRPTRHSPSTSATDGTSTSTSTGNIDKELDDEVPEVSASSDPSTSTNTSSSSNSASSSTASSASGDHVHSRSSINPRRQAELRALMELIHGKIAVLFSRDSMFKQRWDYINEHFSVQGSHPEMLCDAVGQTSTSLNFDLLQSLLDAHDLIARCRITLALLNEEVEHVELREKLARQVEQKAHEAQRKHILMMQLNMIKKELGIAKDDKESVIAKLRERLQPKLHLIPADAKKLIDDEMERLETLEPSSSEFNVVRNRLDWLTQMPWKSVPGSTAFLGFAHLFYLQSCCTRGV